MYVCILRKGQQTIAHGIGYNRERRRTDADACSSAQKGKQDGGVAGSTRRSSEQREPPKTCTEEAMDLWRMKEREKRPNSVRQHFVLSTRDALFSPSSPSFYMARREPFGH